MITPELIAALDDLIQAGARASSALRSRLEQLVQGNPAAMPSLNQVAVSAGVLQQVQSAERTEQSVPQLIVHARDAVKRLGIIADQIGDSDLAQSLNARVSAISQQMQAAGVGTNWLTVLGLGAAAVAAYMLWQHYGKRAVATFSRPEPVDSDLRPQVRGMRRALNSFSNYRPRLSGCNNPRMGRFGATEKYEFEPESRLEGYRRKARRAR